MELRLNSRGGSYEGGIVLAQTLSNFIDFRTVVPTEGQCLSACAIVFMAGREQALERGGQLGFHAPYLTVVEDQSYTSAEISLVYAVALESISDLTELASKIRLENGLIAERLRRGKGEFYFIDTVDKAGRWGIELSGIALNPKLSPDDIITACFNARAWKCFRTVFELLPAVKGGMGLDEFPENPTIADVLL